MSTKIPECVLFSLLLAADINPFEICSLFILITSGIWLIQFNIFFIHINLTYTVLSFSIQMNLKPLFSTWIQLLCVYIMIPANWRHSSRPLQISWYPSPPLYICCPDVVLCAKCPAYCLDITYLCVLINL